MKLYYDDIVIKKKRLIEKGFIDVSLGINVIIGKNGSGKTLTMKNCFLNSNNIEYSKVFIDQNNDNIIDSLSVIENISLSKDSIINQIIINKLKEYDFDYLLERPVKTLSGGEKRLVNLFRGILSDEKIIFIDEPTNDLDYIIVNKIINILKDISKNKILIVISHDDRILSIGNKIFKIVEQRIIEENSKDNNIDIACKDIFKIQYKKDNQILNNIFKINIVSIIISIIICIISGIDTYIFSINKNYNNETLKLDDNEIILYHEFSNISMSLLQNSFPMFCADLIYETNTIKQLKFLNRMEEYLKSSHTTKYNLDIENNELFDVYPFEYYDVNEKKYYYTIKHYLDKYYPGQDVSLDCSELFITPRNYTYADREVIAKITKEQFIECSNELKTKINSNSLEVTCTILILKEGISFDDFYNSLIFKKLQENENNLIQTNELIFIVDNVKEIQKGLSLIKNINIFSSLNVIMDFILLFVLLIIRKNRFFIIRDYHYNFADAKDSIRMSINNRYPKLFLILLFIIYNIILFKDKDFSIINYYPSILFTLFSAIDYKISNLIIIKFIKYTFNWRTR